VIKYYSHKNIDKEQWDACINESGNGNVYAWSWYLDIIFPEWGALIEDNYQSVMPLPISQKMGIKYMYQPFFAQQLGVFSRKHLSKERIHLFLAAIPRSVMKVDYHMNIYNRLDSDHRMIENQNYELDLISPYEKIYKSYSKNLKRNLKKGVRANLRILPNVRPEDVVSLFRNNRGSDVQHWGEAEYKRLLQLIYQAIHRGQAEVIGVYDERNELLCGGVFFSSHKRIVFLFSGSSEAAKDCGAMPYMLNHMIQQYSSKNIIFDFEGSNNPSLARFYSGFGSRKVIYQRWKQIRLPFPFSLFT
jgi:hypothetical protein